MSTDQEERFYVSARACARRQAYRFRLAGDIADEFEQSFVVKWLFKAVDPPLWTWPAQAQDSYLRRAAHNHAIQLQRDLQREVLFATPAEYACLGEPQIRSREAEMCPVSRLLRSQLWVDVLSCLRRLRPRHRSLLARFLFGSVTVEDLACATGRSPEAVHDDLYYARKRLRSALAASGLTESELRAYLRFPAAGPVRAPRSRFPGDEYDVTD